MITATPLWIKTMLAAVMVLSTVRVARPAPSEPAISIADRNYYLADLLRPHRYSPGKNSFLIRNLVRGQRKTILRLAGNGSVRHLWSTWSIPGDDSVVAPPGRVILRVFVDHESRPAVAGSLDELCRAAEATGTSFVPLPAFNYKGAFNFYLPIFFSRHIRIEIEATDLVEEFYTQIDYRLDSNERRRTRLVSEQTTAGLVLNYAGENPLTFHEDEKIAREPSEASQDLQFGPDSSRAEFSIDGPGVIRRITFRGDTLSDLLLEICWDGEAEPSVRAPLKYFFADFVNAAMESRAGEMTSYFPMPVRTKARILLYSPSGSSRHVRVDYSMEHMDLPKDTPHFHAKYDDIQESIGFRQYSVLKVRGKGLFLGVNLFDTGHNHGGGDSALIDAETSRPRVLHGICGEDYFSFAWHHTGTMTLLTGAPVHERRYRLHLENPYPFHASFQFLFGVFAGQHPKGVVFWYQVSEPRRQGEWVALDLPWKVLGPLGLQTQLPAAVDSRSYRTIVPIKDPTPLQERWQEAEMDSGFLDLTYQFRHYAMTKSGTGYVAGSSRTKLTTYVYSPSSRILGMAVGHDDSVVIRVNGALVAQLSERSGFELSRCQAPLRRGWNTLDLILSNEENVNWRWLGVSLALRRGRMQSQDLRFSSEAYTIKPAPN